MIASFRYWLADRSELIRSKVELENFNVALRDKFWAASERSERLAGENRGIRDQLKVAEANADVFRDQRDEARAKLVPPTRDPVTGRWARKS